MRRRVTVLVLALVVLLGLSIAIGVSLRSGPSDGSVAKGPTPAGSARLGRRGPAEPTPLPEQPQSDPEVPVEAGLVEIIVVEAPIPRDRKLERNSFQMTLMGPGAVFPGSDEAAFPSHPILDELQQIVDAPQPSSRADKEERLRWAERAQDDLLPPRLDASNPWTTVAALEVERIRAQMQYALELDEAVAEFEAEHGHSPWRSRTVDERVRWKTMAPVHQTSDQLTLAQAMLEAHPAGPLAEYARIYLLDALSEISGEAYSAAEAAHTCVAILAETEDEFVAQVAVGQMETWFEQAELSEDDFEVLRSAASRFPGTASTIQLFALEQAWQQRSDRETSYWFRELSSTHASGCWCRDALDLEAEGIAAQSACGHPCQFLERTRRRLLATRTFTPRTWQEAVEASVARCIAKTGGEVVGAGGLWDQGWRWQWPHHDALTDCIDASQSSTPEPPAGQRVVLFAGSSAPQSSFAGSANRRRFLSRARAALGETVRGLEDHRASPEFDEADAESVDSYVEQLQTEISRIEEELDVE